ncbi:exosome complex RNA-binding protein Csl4 [Candidatus Micrarchaeota archaeon]|nr:exosome complex RNA-binding protein Csl4 [Candidatus Micrarchaeota archaeon]
MANIKGKHVIPGESMGTEEEFVPGLGTYVEGEEIRSSAAGMLSEEDRSLSVSRRNLLSSLRSGSVVLGRVENVVEPIALISVLPIQGGNVRFAQLPDNCVLHASRIKDGFVKNVRDELRIGDIVRAKISEIRQGEIHVSTEGAEFGVLKAFCIKCRHPLALLGGALSCSSCGNKENRKLASDYRSVSI